MDGDNAMIAETLGTMMLVLFGDGAVAAVVLYKSKAHNSGWIVIATGWGFAVMIGAFTSSALGGPGHINPAVTLAEILRHNIPTSVGVQYIAGQFLGALAGGVLVFLAYYLHWEGTADQGAKLAVFCTAPAIRSYPWNAVTEIIGTFALVFGVFAIFGKAVGAIPPGLGPFLVGALVWGIGLSLGGPTGYAINPARDLGPRIAHFVLPIPGKGDSDWMYSWVPVVGPLIGAVIAAVLAGALTM
jgi:glycerol uptake facilitator protein